MKPLDRIGETSAIGVIGDAAAAMIKDANGGCFDSALAGGPTCGKMVSIHCTDALKACVLYH